MPSLAEKFTRSVRHVAIHWSICAPTAIHASPWAVDAAGSGECLQLLQLVHMMCASKCQFQCAILQSTASVLSISLHTNSDAPCAIHCWMSSSYRIGSKPCSLHNGCMHPGLLTLPAPTFQRTREHLDAWSSFTCTICLY